MPFLVWILIIISIDPYNYFSKNLNIVDNQVKLDIPYKLNPSLYKLLEFKKHPTQYILLGDSRTDALNVIDIKKYSNKNFTNLAYGGGTLQEIINTFWVINKQVDLKEVYIGLNFNLYNKYIKNDRVSESSEIMKNILSYTLCNYSNKSTLLILENKILGINTKIGIPNSSKEEFWMHQLNVSANGFYKLYEYPISYFDELKAISKYCNEKAIKLVFFIPPTHIDLQKKVQYYNLQNNEALFKSDLKKLGDLYDFDYPSDLTNNKENFKDPFHFTYPISLIVIKELFTSETKYYGKYFKCITYGQ